MSQHRSILLLGTNLGDKDKHLKTAIKALEKKHCKVIKKSKISNSMPFGFASKNNFRNIAIIIETEQSPILLLRTVKSIEKEMGRLSDSSVTGGYTDRIIDIDIVTFDKLVYKSKKLEIPHRRNLFEREFSIKLINELEIIEKHNI